MINTMLDLSRLEANEMPVEFETFQLAGIAREGLTRLGARAERVVLDGETGGGSLMAVGDPDLLVRVLVNMVDNALDFSPAAEPVTVRFSNNGDFARVAVSDRGPGVAPETIERVFDKFGQGDTERSRTGSAGLGLAFCRLAVEAQGGRVGVESPPGQGATFWFDVPRPDPSPEPTDSSSSSQARIRR